MDKQDLCVIFYEPMCIYLMYSHFQQNNAFNDAYLFKIGQIPSWLQNWYSELMPAV